MNCPGLQPGDEEKSISSTPEKCMAVIKEVALTSCSIAANVCSKKYNVTVALKMIYGIFRSDEMKSNAAFLKI
jgi:hypothetical protein